MADDVDIPAEEPEPDEVPVEEPPVEEEDETGVADEPAPG